MSIERIPVLDSPIFLLDYDGTLAPIQDDPMKAFPHPEVVPLLNQLREAFPIWIVTGRHLRDAGILLGLELPAIGLHGLQKGILGAEIHTTLSSEVQKDIEAMRLSLPVIAETRVEDKEYTFAVHYRGAVREDLVIESLKSWLEKLPPSLVAIWGKKVLELKPKGISKGTAVKELIDEFPGHQPIYIGDDTTDEAAFEVLNQIANHSAVSIKVGVGITSANYRIPDVDSVITYLKQYSTS